jgi:hypothetical protein
MFLPKTLTVAHLTKKLPAFYETREMITTCSQGINRLLDFVHRPVFKDSKN